MSSSQLDMIIQIKIFYVVDFYEFYKQQLAYKTVKIYNVYKQIKLSFRYFLVEILPIFKIILVVF